MEVELFTGKEAVKKTSSYTKKHLQAFVNDGLEQADRGICRVWYDKTQDFWNEFEFTGLSEFRHKLALDTEPDLVDMFTKA